VESNGKNKPEIKYPCEWQYKLIGSNYATLSSVVVETLKNRSHSISKSNESSQGKYTSINIVIEVENEDDRNRIFGAFQSHPDIKMVL